MGFLNIKFGVLRRGLRGKRILIGKSLEKFLGLYAHHQMRSALEIETEMNVISEVCFDARPLEVVEMRPPAVRSDHNIKTYNRNDADDDRSLE